LSLAAITEPLVGHYPRLRTERIVAHSHISPGRKTDPGASFDWVRYRSLISKCS
jgi:AmpD protein